MTADGIEQLSESSRNRSRYRPREAIEVARSDGDLREKHPTMRPQALAFSNDRKQRIETSLKPLRRRTFGER